MTFLQIVGVMVGIAALIIYARGAPASPEPEAEVVAVVATDELLSLWTSVQGAARVAAAAMLAEQPDLDMVSLISAYETEMWSAVVDVSQMAQNGALS